MKRDTAEDSEAKQEEKTKLYPGNKKIGEIKSIKYFSRGRKSDDPLRIAKICIDSIKKVENKKKCVLKFNRGRTFLYNIIKKRKRDIVD